MLLAPYLLKPQHNSLGFKLNSCCVPQRHAPLFPVSPRYLLSEESDKILEECEKEEFFFNFLLQLLLFKDLASLVLEGTF